jgi:hypothetical protein
VAGIAAMVLTYVLGTAMGLNNTATFMSSCVAFVAVSLWTDSRISRRRRGTAREAARDAARGPGAEAGPERAAAREGEPGPYRDLS